MTPEQIRAKKNNLFATYATMNDVMRFAAKSADGIICVGIAVNTTLELLAKEAEEDA